MPTLADWDSFYVIVGSAAGALIGLQFVVMTLVAVRPPERVAEAGPIFATPTIIHFSSVLLLSALLRVPWPVLTPLAASWGLLGLAGIIYMVIIARAMNRQAAYEPVFEDWLFHALLPLLAYVILAVAALDAADHERDALFGVGGASLLLLFVGIHNAWDTIAYHVWVNLTKSGPEKPVQPGKRTKR
ncbi:MAG TPA: hypothetical protein VFV77_00625 [Gammaproteobacteria bacterium]|nr:hypothetical protein [Gammaproteobacteria bacterium]